MNKRVRPTTVKRTMIQSMANPENNNYLDNINSGTVKVNKYNLDQNEAVKINVVFNDSKDASLDKSSQI